jgi:hypothetical protein
MARPLARQAQLRYNYAMTQWHRLRLWLALALAVVLVAAIALWLRGVLPLGGSHSALPTPALSGVSPLPTPTPRSAAAPPRSWTTGGAALLWVALGIVLALGIAFLVLRRHRHDTA